LFQIVVPYGQKTLFPFYAHVNDSGFAQHLKMMGQSRFREINLAARTGFLPAAGQLFKNLKAYRIAQRIQDGG
jgi:hypothetical protein